MNKTCKKCQTEKDINEFEIRKDNGNYRHVCRQCRFDQAVDSQRKKRVSTFVYREPTKEWLKADTEEKRRVFRLRQEELDILQKEQFTRCEWCRNPFSRTVKNKNWYNDKYCSEWCWEIDNPPEIKHVCKVCGDVVVPYYRGRGNQQIAGYPKYCNGCRPESVKRGMEAKKLLAFNR